MKKLWTRSPFSRPASLRAKRAGGPARPSGRLALEPLESRNLLAVFSVLNALDSGTDSLRWAIEQANASPGADAIHFNIGGGGPQTIALTTGLPTVTEAVDLDATTQPGYSGVPIIELSGGSNPMTTLILADHSGSSVQGFAVNGSMTEGLWLFRGGSHVVAGNYFGTDLSGTTPVGLIRGVWIAGSSGNLIGSNGDGVNDARERNVISAGSGIFDTGGGVYIQDWDGPAQDNVIAGNYIGTDASGTTALPNNIGVVDRGENTVIGTDGTGVAAAKRNVIAGNLREGVVLQGLSRIAGNYMGVDVTGSTLLSNGSTSVFVFSPGNVIGTNGDGVGDAVEGNLIAGTSGAIQLQGDGATGNVVAGNLIGVTADGTTSFGAQAIGGGMVWMSYRASGNRIGTNGDGVSDALERNVIVTTGGIAVRIGGGDPGDDGNVVAGNYIGTDATGMTQLGGIVYVSGAATNNVIGTNGDGVGDAVEGNVIGAGVEVLQTGTAGNVLAGNSIGVAADGVTAIGGGLVIYGGASSNRVGTNGDGVGDAAERNIIRSVQILHAGTDGNVLAGNYVGVGADGLTSLGGTGDGALIAVRGGASGNRIGTNADGMHDAAEGNVISGGLQSGVLIFASNANAVAGNRIGTTADGSAPLPNAEAGIVVVDSTGNSVGGAAPAAGNLIAYNSGPGVYVGSATGVSILGNAIHSNGSLGIDLEDGAVTPNDPGDGDAGANDFQNFPELAAAASTGSGIAVSGTLDSTPNSTFRVELFANSALDPSSHGEGRTYLGFVVVATDGAGVGSFSVTLSGAVPVGEFVTATATNAAGSTSEFSQGVEVVEGNQAPVAAVAGPTSGVRGHTQWFTFSATDDPADAAVGFTYQINWGDGSPVLTIGPEPGNGSGVEVDHVYDTSGTYVVSVAAIDQHGAASDPATATVAIGAVALLADSCEPGRVMLAIGGTTANDVIVVEPYGGAGQVRVKINGVFQGVYAPTGRIVVYGQSGNDDLQIAGSITRESWLYGGEGDDRLKGGGGHSVLLGNEGNDLLAGGSGNDVLIGGEGEDRLVGNADEDILIGGTTDFDDLEEALCAIVDEWTSNASYATRVAHLSGLAGGLNDGFFLTTGSAPVLGNHHHRHVRRRHGRDCPVLDDVAGAATVHDDNARDLLTGSEGKDWFFANLALDGGDDATRKDSVTDLHANEFASDLDFIAP
jgi:titin